MKAFHQSKHQDMMQDAAFAAAKQTDKPPPRTLGDILQDFKRTAFGPKDSSPATPDAVTLVSDSDDSAASSARSGSNDTSASAVSWAGAARAGPVMSQPIFDGIGDEQLQEFLNWGLGMDDHPTLKAHFGPMNAAVDFGGGAEVPSILAAGTGPRTPIGDMTTTDYSPPPPPRPTWALIPPP